MKQDYKKRKWIFMIRLKKEEDSRHVRTILLPIKDLILSPKFVSRVAHERDINGKKRMRVYFEIRGMCTWEQSRAIQKALLKSDRLFCFRMFDHTAYDYDSIYPVGNADYLERSLDLL